MAHGLPDYYRGVDVAYQALSRMLVRPTYGPANSVSDSTIVTANDETELCSVTGQGMIYGGLIHLHGPGGQGCARPLLYIDGVVLAQLSFAFMDKWRVFSGKTIPFYLLCLDDVNLSYSAGLSPGYTFESSFKIAYDENNGGTPNVYYKIVYALIT